MSLSGRACPDASEPKTSASSISGFSDRKARVEMMSGEASMVWVDAEILKTEMLKGEGFRAGRGGERRSGEGLMGEAFGLLKE